MMNYLKKIYTFFRDDLLLTGSLIFIIIAVSIGLTNTFPFLKNYIPFMEPDRSGAKINQQVVQKSNFKNVTMPLTGQYIPENELPDNKEMPNYSHASNPYMDQLKTSDGNWKYTNRLIYSSSPYLLLHAHNPVKWHEWGPDAFKKARQQDKPIFMSVGYSTCYWCHVMERKVFSNPEIARMMNKWFINVKIDRERRPALDDFYMKATYMINQSGGWPNNLFLTPDLKPYYAGTYFPPKPFRNQVLPRMHNLWSQQRNKTLKQADKLYTAMQRAGGAPRTKSVSLDESLVGNAAQSLMNRYDTQYGGFGSGNKFPQSMNLRLLLEHGTNSGKQSMVDAVTHTLDEMRQGGIYDHIGKGFHRYSTDPQWRVPHFEKMLYNQAQLTRTYLEGYQATENSQYERTAREILSYVDRMMTGEDGQFYSALDAEVDGEEGSFYVWTKSRLRDVIGDETDFFLSVYNLASKKEGHGKVLYQPRSLAETANQLGMTESELRSRLRPLEQTLFENRHDNRTKPLLDKKVLAGWNGMMIDAYAYAYQVLDDESYLTQARRAADFAAETLIKDGDLHRSYRNGKLQEKGYLQDYAYYINGLITLHEASEDPQHLDLARQLTETMIDRFWDDSNAGFYSTAEPLESGSRSKSFRDQAVPSANSIAVDALLRLSQVTNNPIYQQKARRTLKQYGGALDNQQQAAGYASLAMAVSRHINTSSQSSTRTSKTDQSNASESNRGFSFGAGNARDKLSLDVNLSSTDTEGQKQINTAFQLDDGWHVNANPATLDYLIPVTVSVDTSVASLESVKYPDGTRMSFQFSDQALSVYKGRTEITAIANVKSDEVKQLPVIFRYQACNDRKCLPPDTITKTIALENS